MEKLLGAEGWLASVLSSYEFRPGQLKMARAVEEVFRRGGCLLVEAGPGVGKTLAYLLPALLSGQRVVISTGTKALQEQLLNKDLPLLEPLLPSRYRVELIKGRQNYLCLKRLRDLRQQPLPELGQEAELLERIEAWAQRTEMGDRTELEDLPDDSRLWQAVCSTTDHCVGSDCAHKGLCFVARLKQRAAAADLLVVNHHLFFADLALRERGFGEVLPRSRAVVFDEAHMLEDVAVQHFGSQVSSFRLMELVRDARRLVQRAASRAKGLTRVLDRLERSARSFFGSLGPVEERRRIRPQDLDSQTRKALDRLLGSLERLALLCDEEARKEEDFLAIGRRSREIGRDLEEILSGQEARVSWLEERSGGVFLHASPIEVGDLLRERVFDLMRVCVLTSATLTAEGRFDYVVERLGVEGAEELVVDSSFDYAGQALLYVPPPEALPLPTEEGFLEALVEELRGLLLATRGRALCLFTSFRHMEAAFHALEGEIPYPCLLQGQRPKSVLLDEFRQRLDSVLFATTSFWQGIDVVGEALSCVVVDRLPFAVPTEPLVEARCEALEASGRSAFLDYQLPSAVLLLKQGLGRLIRSRADRGVLAVLDRRLLTRPYGQAFLRSLPSCPITSRLDDVSAFLERGTLVAGVEAR